MVNRLHVPNLSEIGQSTAQLLTINDRFFVRFRGTPILPGVKGVGTGEVRGAMAPSFSYKGGISDFAPPPKLKMKIAETAQRIMWIKRNITDHAKNVAEK